MEKVYPDCQNLKSPAKRSISQILAQSPLFLLRKDSHNAETLKFIQGILKEHKLDFLFIDGDHRYEGVRLDFEMYSPLVRGGGLVAFHDIVQDGGAEEVYKFWNETKPNYPHKEFIHQTGPEAMGIGVLWV